MRDDADDACVNSRADGVWDANQAMLRGPISPPFMKYFNVGENGKLRFKIDPDIYSGMNRPQTIGVKRAGGELSVGRGRSPVMEWEDSCCAG